MICAHRKRYVIAAPNRHPGAGSHPPFPRFLWARVAAARSDSAVPVALNSVISRSSPRPAALSPAQAEQVAGDPLLRQNAGLDGPDEVAALLERALGIDVDARAAHRVVVGLAHVGPEAADEVEMLPRPEPRASDQRIDRQRRAADDVGARHRSLEVRRHLGAEARAVQPSGQPFGQPRIDVPDRDILDGAHCAEGIGQVVRDASRAHHQQAAGILPREVARRQRRGRGGAPVGDLAAVQHRQVPPGPNIEEKIGRGQRRYSHVRISRIDVHDLDPAQASRVPRRHQKQGRVRQPLQRDGVVVPQRRHRACPEHLPQRLDQRAERQQVAGFFGTVDAHGSAPRSRCGGPHVPASMAPSSWMCSASPVRKGGFAMARTGIASQPI